MAQIFGACPINLRWDRDLDFGQGEINFCPWDIRHFLLDPGIVCSEDLQRAEYLVFEAVYPLDLLKYQFPKAENISDDPEFTHYTTYGEGEDDNNPINSPNAPIRRPLKVGGMNVRNDAIPRCVVQEFWVRDRILMGDLPEEIFKDVNRKLRDAGLSPRKKKDMVFPGGRHIIRSGGEILLDESNPYWDLQWPSEMISWGMEIEHPWGSSEVGQLMKIQEIINKIGGSMVENTLLMSNSIWIGDTNALLPEQWRDLGDKPALIIKKKPGSELKREPAPPIPGSMFAMQQWLSSMFDNISGMTDILQGKAPSNMSGVAMEQLSGQAQSILRLQARNLEEFLVRIGQKIISRIFQFYDTDRILRIVGPDKKIIPFEYRRDELLHKLGGRNVREAFRDFSFDIEPLSSLSMSKMQAIIAKSNFYSMGLVPGKEVLKAAGYPNPEGTIEEARLEQAQKLAPAGSPIAQQPPPQGPPKQPGPRRRKLT